ncbi:DUF302 domain-containing protein [Profundibacter sp.]
MAESLDRLTGAVEGAGAKVFARVEHAKGVRMIGQDLAPEALLIFGKPEVGMPAMQMNPLAYQNLADMLAPYDIPADAPIVMKLTKVLGALTGKPVAE